MSDSSSTILPNPAATEPKIPTLVPTDTAGPLTVRLFGQRYKLTLKGTDLPPSVLATFQAEALAMQQARKYASEGAKDSLASDYGEDATWARALNRKDRRTMLKIAKLHAQAGDGQQFALWIKLSTSGATFAEK